MHRRLDIVKVQVDVCDTQTNENPGVTCYTKSQGQRVEEKILRATTGLNLHRSLRQQYEHQVVRRGVK